MPRVREAGDSMLIVEFGDEIDLDVNARVLAAAARLRAAAWPGVRDVVPTCRSVAVAFDPLRTDVAGITEAIQRTADGPVAAEAGRTVDIPVEYGGEAGPDLEEVAARSGLSPEEVVARHASRPYRVLMLGFLPGFAYLGPVDSSIVAPRRPSPRRRVPPGSVAIAGGQTGIYPQASPGGWQIVGRTTLHPFAASRTPPALLSPGDAVRFVPAAPGSLGSFDAAWAEVPSTGPARPEPAGVRPPTSPLVGRGVTVLTAGLMTTVQDGGRWGHQHEGVPVSGAMDLEALRRANHAMGHPPTAAALEATLSGLELRVDHAGAVAIAGADLGATLDGRPVPLHTPTSCGAGAVLRLTGRARGTRAYVAFDGAIDVAPCLGSRATDMTSGLGGLGGRRLRAGDRLTLGASAAGSSRREPAATRPVPAGGARVRVLPGPHDEWFSAGAIALLQRTRFELTPESNRMGYRLHGPQPVPRDPREMLSDATCAGGLQVPPSGQPILLMADRQVTGGYPIIATVITADLPVAGQLAPGDWIEFELCTRGEAIRALAEQERAYGAAE
jgi:KipI family sensor histidine kinase inhibitor